MKDWQCVLPSQPELIQLSADGSFLVFTAATSRLVFVYETRPWRLIQVLPWHRASIGAICLSDRYSLAIASSDGTVEIYRRASAGCEWELWSVISTAIAAVSCLEWSRGSEVDQELLVVTGTTGDAAVMHWWQLSNSKQIAAEASTATPELLCTERISVPVRKARWSHDNFFLATTCGKSSLVKIWFVEEEHDLFRERFVKRCNFVTVQHSAEVTGILWLDTVESRNILATMGSDGSCRLWGQFVHPLSGNLLFQQLAVVDPCEWISEDASRPLQYHILNLSFPSIVARLRSLLSQKAYTTDIHQKLEEQFHSLLEMSTFYRDLFLMTRSDGSTFLFGIEDMDLSTRIIPKVLALSHVEVADGFQNAVTCLGGSDTCAPEKWIAHGTSLPAMTTIWSKDISGTFSLLDFDMNQALFAKRAFRNRERFHGFASQITSLHNLECDDMYVVSTKSGRHALCKVEECLTGSGFRQLYEIPSNIVLACSHGRFLVRSKTKELQIRDADGNILVTAATSIQIDNLILLDCSNPAAVVVCGVNHLSAHYEIWTISLDNRLLQQCVEIFPDLGGSILLSQGLSLLDHTYVVVLVSNAQLETSVRSKIFQFENGMHFINTGICTDLGPVNTSVFATNKGGFLALASKKDIHVWKFNPLSLELTSHGVIRFPDDILHLSWFYSAATFQTALAIVYRNAVQVYAIKGTLDQRGQKLDVLLDIPLASAMGHQPTCACWKSDGALLLASESVIWRHSGFLSSDSTDSYVELTERPPVLPALLETKFALLPEYHPDYLIGLLMMGNYALAKSILLHLYRFLKATESSDIHWIPPLPLAASLASPSGDETRTKFLFSNSLDANGEDIHQTEPNEFNASAAAYMADRLSVLRLPLLAGPEQIRLLAIIEATLQIDSDRFSMDAHAVRFVVSVRLFTYMQRVLPANQRSDKLDARDISWAYYSESQSSLISFCNLTYGNRLLWPEARALGMGMWIRDCNVLKQQMEIVARNQFMLNDEKDPTRCGLLYLAMGKRKLWQNLWRSATHHSDHNTMVKFLSNNFDEERWKSAALKNAFVLLGKQRNEYAATFFLLGDRLKDAVSVCIKQMNDPQLAIVIARMYEGDRSPIYLDLLRNNIFEPAKVANDRWTASLALISLQLYHEAYLATFHPLSEIILLDSASVKNAIAPDSSRAPLSSSSGDTKDVLLLLLYKHLRKVLKQKARLPGVSLHPHTRSIVNSSLGGVCNFLLTMVTAYDDAGCPLFALEATCLAEDILEELIADPFVGMNPFPRKSVESLVDVSNVTTGAVDWNDGPKQNIFTGSRPTPSEARGLFDDEPPVQQPLSLFDDEPLTRKPLSLFDDDPPPKKPLSLFDDDPPAKVISLFDDHPSSGFAANEDKVLSKKEDAFDKTAVSFKDRERIQHAKDRLAQYKPYLARRIALIVTQSLATVYSNSGDFQRNQNFVTYSKDVRSSVQLLLTKTLMEEKEFWAHVECIAVEARYLLCLGTLFSMKLVNMRDFSELALESILYILEDPSAGANRLGPFLDILIRFSSRFPTFIRASLVPLLYLANVTIEMEGKCYDRLLRAMQEQSEIASNPKETRALFERILDGKDARGEPRLVGTELQIDEFEIQHEHEIAALVEALFDLAVHEWILRTAEKLAKDESVWSRSLDLLTMRAQARADAWQVQRRASSLQTYKGNPIEMLASLPQRRIWQYMLTANAGDLCAFEYGVRCLLEKER